MSAPLHIVLQCADAIAPKVRYVFDTLFMARGIPVVYSPEPPTSGAWISYARTRDAGPASKRSVSIAHSPGAWQLFSERRDVGSAESIDGLVAVLVDRIEGFDTETDIAFDIVANAFYFLSSWSERASAGSDVDQTRRMHAGSVFARLNVPQDIVDQYLDCIVTKLLAQCERCGNLPWKVLAWPRGSEFALVLSHDVDFLPSGLVDTLKQGATTMFRHFVRQRDVGDGLSAMIALVRALVTGRDAYGCVPEIIAKEVELGVRSSFQVAVGHRHPNDVNYRIEDDRVRDYLRVILESGFDLCVHGSYRSTENPLWYAEEVALLTERLGRPTGSRQHFLSFDYDVLFAAQERAGIRFDMSMGFPDRVGARAGFSYPYFPYNIVDDRPYNVLEISLFLMDVTLRSYMGLKGPEARDAVDLALSDLRRKRGCVSAVWHPIVFGGARDPGYDRLFWQMVNHAHTLGGLTTDGSTIDQFWRSLAGKYESFTRSVSPNSPKIQEMPSRAGA